MKRSSKAEVDLLRRTFGVSPWRDAWTVVLLFMKYLVMGRWKGKK